MPSGLSGRQFGWRIGWRALILLTLMFGVPLTLYGLDHYLDNDNELTLKDAVRLTTGTFIGFCLYPLFALSIVRPCWRRLHTLGWPRIAALIVAILMLLDWPFFIALHGDDYFGPVVGSPDGKLPIYLVTGMILVAAMAFAIPSAATSNVAQRRIALAMLAIFIVILLAFVFYVGMAKWAAALHESLGDEEAPHPAFVPLVFMSYWVILANRWLCVALAGLGLWSAVLSRRGGQKQTQCLD